MRPSRFALLAALIALLLVPASASAFKARGSVGEAYVLDARKGENLWLLDASGDVVRRGRADRFGSRIFRELPARGGYRVRRQSGTTTKPFAVLRRGQNPPQSFFRGKRLAKGLNYVTVRDGVEIAMTVRLPPGKTLADGPFPTLVELSGYQIASPGDLLASVVASVTGGSAKPDPLVPAGGTAVGSVIAPLLNFAVVSVQMRGSGCSGGAFDLFGLPTTYDGYDADRDRRRAAVGEGREGRHGRDLVLGHHPALHRGHAPAAPGGDRADVGHRRHLPGDRLPRRHPQLGLRAVVDPGPDGRGGARARGRPAVGEGPRRRPATGTASPTSACACRPRTRWGSSTATSSARPSLFAHRSPGAWMKDIEAPTFLVGQFQDEQTGGHFAESLGQLAGNPKVWLSLQNGVHADSLGPTTLTRWVEFLSLYVADEIPRIPDPVRGLSNELYRFLADAPASPVEPARFAGMTLAEARAAFERDPRVRLLMDNGGGPAGPGLDRRGVGARVRRVADPRGPAEHALAAPGRAPRPRRAARGRRARLTPPTPPRDPRRRCPATARPTPGRPARRTTGAPLADGSGLGFTTAPLDADVVIAGPSSLDLYLRSTAPDTDLQVTLSEVRPDGDETYVQNGWLRASHRKLDRATSTALDPHPTHLRRDAAPLPSGRYTIARVPLFPVAHAFRAGSRIRVTVQAPGGDRPRWAFSSIDRGRARNTLGLGHPYASRLVLPVVEGATALGTPLRSHRAARAAEPGLRARRQRRLAA